MMTSKERLLYSIKGEKTDRIAWSPFLPYFWESLPEKIRKKGMLSFYQSIEADALFRGFCTLLKITYKDTQIIEQTNGNQKQVVYKTPKGDLTFVYSYTKQSDTWFLTGHPIKEEKDYHILIDLYKNMKMEPFFDKYQNGLQVIGDEGLLVPIISPEMKSSFQSLIERWVGTVDLTYHLYDFPELVEDCLKVMCEKSQIGVQLAAECGAEAFIFWEDSSTTNISPNQFVKYVAPEITNWAKILHENDQYLIHHACGSIRDLILPMCETGIDMIESISPPPTGNIDVCQAQKIIPDHVGLIGGIEPTILLNSTMNELEKEVFSILDQINPRRFILGNSDSCPPGVDIEKFKKISEWVRNHV